MKDIYIFMGKAATGKDTALNLYSKQEDYHIMVSDTTRPMRENETNGIDYNYIDNDLFEKRIDQNMYLEHTMYNVCSNKWYYGTAKDCIVSDKINVGVLNPDGVYQLNNSIFKDRLYVVLFKSDEDESRKRFILREKNKYSCNKLDDKFQKRKEQDEIDFYDIENKLNNKNIPFSVIKNDSTITALKNKLDKIIKENKQS